MGRGGEGWEGEGRVRGGHGVEGAEVTDLECIDNCNVVTPTLAGEVPTYTVSFFSLVLRYGAQHMTTPDTLSPACTHQRHDKGLLEPKS